MDSWKLNSNEESNEDFFAARLAALRENHQVSARKMSLALDQNSSYINRIENKKAFPSMQVFFQICDYLDITPGAFFEWGGVNVPDEIQKIIPILERLTPRQLEMINELAVELAELNEKDSSEKQNLMEI